jgi:hypothetical protein
MKPLVTFFMIVIDRDIVIADFAVRSYAKVQGVPFKLVVYSNWVRSDLKERYFPGWSRLPYVEIWDDPARTDDRRPDDRRHLEGPCELAYRVWDRELKKIDTPYHATVDPDFEILDGRFVKVMIDTLEADPGLVAMSTDYSPRLPAVYERFSREVVSFNERWDTWFCIYKRAALACEVSHIQHEEWQPGAIPRNVWDDAGYLQKALREQHGWRLAALGPAWRRSYIHYGAFRNNRDIDERNVRLYRALQTVRRHGLWRLGDPLSRGIAFVLDRWLFGHVDRSSYLPGWAEELPVSRGAPPPAETPSPR